MCQRYFVCLLEVMSPPITQFGGSRADPQQCTCLFLSIVCVSSYLLVKTPSLTRKMSCAHHKGRQHLLHDGVYCQDSPVNKKRKRSIKAFPAYRSHVLPLILFSESVCLLHTNVSQCKLFQRIKQSFLAVNIIPFQTVFNES